MSPSEDARSRLGRNDYMPSAEVVTRLKERAKFVRLETIRLIEIAKTGHYTSVFSAAETFAALYYDVMSLKYGEPKWPSRDRFLMGKGHAAVGLFPHPRGSRLLPDLLA